MATHKFHSVEDFLSFLPEDERRITHILRDLVLEALPDVSEKLSYNVPFYRIHSNICFIWPGAVLWGKKRSYEGVRFGFTKGYLIGDEMGYLNKGSRKEVYWRDFTEPLEIDHEIMRMYLLEASLIDEERAKMKRSK